MAERFIDTLAAQWSTDDLTDNHRVALAELAAAKLAGDECGGEPDGLQQGETGPGSG